MSDLDAAKRLASTYHQHVMKIICGGLRGLVSKDGIQARCQVCTVGRRVLTLSNQPPLNQPSIETCVVEAHQELRHKIQNCQQEYTVAMRCHTVTPALERRKNGTQTVSWPMASKDSAWKGCCSSACSRSANCVPLRQGDSSRAAAFHKPKTCTPHGPPIYSVMFHVATSPEIPAFYQVHVIVSSKTLGNICLRAG